VVVVFVSSEEFQVIVVVFADVVVKVSEEVLPVALADMLYVVAEAVVRFKVVMLFVVLSAVL
jgi:hypothetical protein